MARAPYSVKGFIRPVSRLPGSRWTKEITFLLVFGHTLSPPFTPALRRFGVTSDSIKPLTFNQGDKSNLTTFARLIPSRASRQKSYKIPQLLHSTHYNLHFTTSHYTHHTPPLPFLHLNPGRECIFQLIDMRYHQDLGEICAHQIDGLYQALPAQGPGCQSPHR